MSLPDVTAELSKIKGQLAVISKVSETIQTRHFPMSTTYELLIYATFEAQTSPAALRMSFQSVFQ